MDELEIKIALEELAEEKSKIWAKKLGGELSYDEACDKLDELLVRKRILLKEAAV